MKERMINILKHVAADGRTGVQKFAPVRDDIFALDTSFSRLRGYEIWLWYRFNDETVKMEISNIFGTFDFSSGVDPNDLLQPLLLNSSSLGNSFTYISAEVIEENFFLTLRASLEFLLKWGDEDIAYILSNKLIDIEIPVTFSGTLMPKSILVFGR